MNDTDFSLCSRGHDQRSRILRPDAPTFPACPANRLPSFTHDNDHDPIEPS